MINSVEISLLIVKLNINKYSQNFQSKKKEECMETLAFIEFIKIKLI
jgi:hypothetical protein